MELRRSIISAAVTKSGVDIGPDDVEVLATESREDRMHDVVMADGCSNLATVQKRGLTMLWQHDADHPVARVVRAWRQGDSIRARVKFPPLGTSIQADEARRLVKSGVVDSVSIGFRPLKSEPLRGGGVKFTSWEWLELSFVSVPALPSAIVTAKRGPKAPPRERRAPMREDLELSRIIRQQRLELAALEAQDRAETDALIEQTYAAARRYGIIS